MSHWAVFMMFSGSDPGKREGPTRSSNDYEGVFVVVFLAAFFFATFFLVAAFFGAAAFLAAFFFATFFLVTVFAGADFADAAFFLATDSSSKKSKTSCRRIDSSEAADA
jgi:hypothetical protein